LDSKVDIGVDLIQDLVVINWYIHTECETIHIRI